MSEKPEALADRLDDQRMNLIERLADENERLREAKAATVVLCEQINAENNLLRGENQQLREALESIAANACCDKCQEAALVAKAALRRENV